MTTSSESSVGILHSGPRVAEKHLNNFFTLVVPMTGAGAAFAGFAPPTLTTGIVFVVFFLLGGMGVGISLHRYFSHHAFRTSPAMRFALGVLGSWAWQGSIEQWVSDHRRHHRFADTPLDPHSPHFVKGEAPSSVLAGLFHAHFGWMLFGDASDPVEYAPDISRDPIARWCSRYYWPLALSTLALPALVGFVASGASEAVACLLWAGFVRVLVIQHFTWAIASIGHRFGAQEDDAKDEARNSRLLAVLLFGEGLHSYHHVNPSNGINQPEAFDLNGKILKVWRRIGLIWALRGADPN